VTRFKQRNATTQRNAREQASKREQKEKKAGSAITQLQTTNIWFQLSFIRRNISTEALPPAGIKRQQVAE
jgi:hypothetical protein